MAAGLLNLIGVIAGVAVLCVAIWAVCRCFYRDGGKEGGGGVSSAAGKHEGLLNKSQDAAAVVAVPQPEGGGRFQQRGPPDPGEGDGEGEAELCAICKARLAEEGWGGWRRLRPCGHAYHAVCIGLWLQRRWVCPVCRASVAVSPTEIMDAMV